MLQVFRGPRPDLTPAQVTAALVAGVPVLSNLLLAFGVYAPSAQQQHALSEALTWGGVFAGLLIGGDAALRTGRNHADATVQSAAVAVPHPAVAALAAAPAASAVHPVAEAPPTDDELDALADPGTFPPRSDDGLPTDEEEAAAPPPGG